MTEADFKLSKELPKQMSSREEYENAVAYADGASTTMWIFLGVFLLIKLLNSVGMEAIFNMILYL